MKQLQNQCAKSNYQCISCPNLRTLCGGMPMRGLTLKEWCEAIRDGMDRFRLSAAYVAKEASCSQRTVERIHAVNIDQDIMRSTGRQIEIVVFGPVTNLLCEMNSDTITSERIAQLQADVAYWKKEAEDWRKENDRKAKIIDRYLD